MSATQQIAILLAGIALFLSVATAVGRYLAARSADGGPSPTIENLNTRINAWWAMVAMLALAMVIGYSGVIVLFAILSFAALREFITLTETKRGDHWSLLTIFFLVLPVQYVLVWDGWYGLYSIFIPVYAFLLMPIVSVVRQDPGRFLRRIAEMQWAMMICIFCLSHVPALLTLDIPGYEGRNLLLIAFLLCVVQFSDVFQYVWGKLLGRHKVAPTISPSKTIEGFLGGVGTATVLGAALWWITPFAVWQAATLALVVALMGFLGGLVMSAIKRDRGIKDWGWVVAGHGGVLDRLDSLVFAAPVFFHLVRYWWTP